MAKEYTYKKQGDGRDSWICFDTETGEKYMVYENPEIESIPKVNVVGLLQSLSSEELNAIKNLLR